MPLLGVSGRVINLSSAAQSPVDPKAMVGQVQLSDFEAYAQSKLALTIWSRSMALSLQDNGPAIIAVNPGSMLGSKMVKEAFGVAGGDIRIGAEILSRAILIQCPLPTLKTSAVMRGIQQDGPTQFLVIHQTLPVPSSRSEARE